MNALEVTAPAAGRAAAPPGGITMDENRAAEFTGRVLADSAAAATIVLAARTGLAERYVREWAGGMFAAGYLTYDATQQRYTLPAEHVPTLATEPGPAFFGGVHQ